MVRFLKCALFTAALVSATQVLALDVHEEVVPQRDSTIVEPAHLDQVLDSPDQDFKIDRANAHWYVAEKSTRRAMTPDEAAEVAKEEASLRAEIAADGPGTVTLHFAFNAIQPLSWSPLSRSLTRLRRAKLTISVVAHADERGTATYNQHLSDERADRVARYLIAHGIPADRVESEGVGMREPAAPGNGAANRRAVIRLVSGDADEEGTP